MKICSKCQKRKPKDRFYRNVCKDCRAKYQKVYRKKHPYSNRDAWLRNRYDLSREEVVSILTSQNGKCMGCCGRVPTDVDHNHLTKKVRGMLCRSCNLILGHAKDNPEVLESLVRYLRADI